MLEKPTALGSKPMAMEFLDFILFRSFWPQGNHLCFGVSWRWKDELSARAFLETRSSQGEVLASLISNYTIIHVMRGLWEASFGLLKLSSVNLHSVVGELATEAFTTDLVGAYLLFFVFYIFDAHSWFLIALLYEELNSCWML